MVRLVKHVLQHRAAGQGGKRGRTDELAGRRGHHYGHPRARLHQLAHQCSRLIRGDAPADADNQLATFHRSTKYKGLRTNSKKTNGAMLQAKYERLGEKTDVSLCSSPYFVLRTSYFVLFT